MPDPNEHSSRLLDPNTKHDRVRRTSGSGDGKVQGVDVPTSIDVIWYIDGKDVKAQSLAFPVDNWTESEARSWLKDNDIDYILFEPAKPKEDEKSFARPKILKSAATPRQWFNVEKNTEIPSVFIYDQIGQDWWGEGISPQAFIEQVKAIESDAFNLFLNTPGGFVNDGLAIYHQLDRLDKYITVYIDGIAASIGSVIAMAGDKIIMPENTEQMIHDPWGMAIGNSRDLRELADHMDRTKERILNIYHKRTGYDRDKISELMANETYISAKDAVEWGFADELEEPKKLAACAFDWIFATDQKDFTRSNIDKKRELERNLREAGWSKTEATAIANRSESVFAEKTVDIAESRTIILT